MELSRISRDTRDRLYIAGSLSTGFCWLCYPGWVTSTWPAHKFPGDLQPYRLKVLPRALWGNFLELGWEQVPLFDP